MYTIMGSIHYLHISVSVFSLRSVFKYAAYNISLNINTDRSPRYYEENSLHLHALHAQECLHTQVAAPLPGGIFTKNTENNQFSLSNSSKHQFSPFKSPAYTVKRLEMISFIYIRAQVKTSTGSQLVSVS